MNKTKIVIMVITILLLGTVIVFFLGRPLLPPQIPFKPPPMISGEYSPSSFLTVSQGSSFQLSITQTSFLDTELTLPFENLTIMAYNDSASPSPSQELTLNYTFSNNPIIISPKGTNSTILTVTVDSGAQTGKYLLYIKFGSSNITHVDGHSLIITVEGAQPTPTVQPTSIVIPKPSILAVISPTRNATYHTNTVDLIYHIDSKVLWSYYGLDSNAKVIGGKLIAFKGNITLNLSEGPHKIMLAVQTEESRYSSVPVAYQTIDLIIDTTNAP